MKKTIIGIFILMLLLVGTIGVLALPDEWGRGAKSNGEIIFTKSSLTNTQKILYSIGLMAISGLKTSYSQGQQVDFTYYERLTKQCNGPAYLTFEVYNSPVGQQSGTAFQEGLSGNYKIPFQPVPSGYTENGVARFTIPPNANIGTWSASVYIYCPSISGSATGYSTVTEKNFEVTGQAPTCTNECTSGEKKCTTYQGYASRYVTDCGNYDSDSCTEWKISNLQDCGGINQCENGQCLTTPPPTQCGTKPSVGSWSDSTNQCGTRTNYKCDSSTSYQWVSYSETKTCGGTPTDKPNFDVQIISWSPEKPTSQDTITVKTKIINNGGTGSMRVETGIFKKSTLNDWYGGNLFSIVSDPIANCEPNEVNLQTRTITLDGGESVDVDYQFKIPLVCTISGGDSTDYAINIDAVEKCFNNGEATGLTDKDVKEITIDSVNAITNKGCKGTCTDGIQNQGETDTDCGGANCNPCRENYRCEKKTDCQGNLVCDNGVCTKEGAVTCIGKEPLLEKDLKSKTFQPTEQEVKNALCSTSKDCCELDGYTTGCVRQENFESRYKIDLTRGFWGTIGDWFTPDSGACVAVEEGEGGEGLCVLAFFEITGDCEKDGLYILIGGIAIIFLFMFVAGKK